MRTNLTQRPRYFVGEVGAKITNVSVDPGWGMGVINPLAPKAELGLVGINFRGLVLAAEGDGVERVFNRSRCLVKKSEVASLRFSFWAARCSARSMLLSPCITR